MGGGSNIGVGVYSLEQSINGIGNVALGNSTGNTITNGSYNTIIGTTADVIDANAQYRIALGALANADEDYQFAIPDDVIKIKWRGVSYELPSADGTAGQALKTRGDGTLYWG